LDVFIPPTKIEPHSDDDDLDLPTLAESLKAISSSFMSSTKIDQLMTELALAQEEDPGCKTIVFSQWTSMLDLVETPIKSYDGTMDVKERENSLQKLMHDAEITIMLVSLKA
ncbi:2145_t:CDS:2, partial [Scutellospora calospora]